MPLRPRDRLCIPVPFYHCFGMVLANLLCFSVGATAVIPSEHFDPLAVPRGIAAERCTAVHGRAPMFIAMLDHPRSPSSDLTSLPDRDHAGAPCHARAAAPRHGAMHCPEILVGYGETEASPLTHLPRRTTLERRTLHAFGASLPHQEARVVVPGDRAPSCPSAAIGEILLPRLQRDARLTTATRPPPPRRSTRRVAALRRPRRWTRTLREHHRPSQRR